MQKYQRPVKKVNVQVGHVKSSGKKSHVVPEIQPLSKIVTNNPSNFQKATKKPNGKGYSKGNYGEETVLCRGSPKSSKTSFSKASEDNFGIPNLPDLEEVDEASKLNHPGLTSNRSKPTSSNVSLNSSSEDDESMNFLEDGNLAIFYKRNPIAGNSITTDSSRGGRGRGRGQRRKTNTGRKSETAKSSSKTR